MMHRFTAGIIGCGQIAGGYDEKMNDDDIRTHAKGYKYSNNISLQCIADIDKDRLEQFATFWNIKKKYVNYSEMLKNEKIDVLSISTKPDSRFEMIKQAVDHGVKLIFCEKPLAESCKEGKQIIDYCRLKNVKVAVNYKRRWDPFHQDIKQNIKKRGYGKPQVFYCSYVRGILNYGSHAIDLIRFYFGEVKWVWAFDRLHEAQSDQSLDVYLLTNSGVGCYFISLSRDYFDHFEYALLFEKRKIEFKKEGMLSYEYSLAENPDYPDLPIFELKSENRHLNKIMKYSIDQLARCLNNSEDPLCTGEDAYQALRIVEAIKKSAKTKERVYIT